LPGGLAKKKLTRFQKWVIEIAETPFSQSECTHPI